MKKFKSEKKEKIDYLIYTVSWISALFIANFIYDHINFFEKDNKGSFVVYIIIFIVFGAAISYFLRRLIYELANYNKNK